MDDLQQVLQTVVPSPPVVHTPSAPSHVALVPPVIPSPQPPSNAPIMPTFVTPSKLTVILPAKPVASVPITTTTTTNVLPTGSILPNITFQSQGTPYYIPLSYLSSLVPKDPLTVSTLNAGVVNVSTLNAVSTFAEVSYTVSSFNQNVFTDYIEATEAYVYDKLTLDNQVLTANATELLLNGNPIVTANNISSIADWSKDPAISTIQANGNDLTDVRFANFSSIIADGLTVVKLTTLFSTTVEVFESTITSETQKLTVSSITGGNGSFDILTANTFINPSASTINCDYINVASNANMLGATFSNAPTFNQGGTFNGTRPNFNTGINTSGANNFNNNNLDNCGQINAGALNLFGSATVGVLADSGGSILTNTAISLATQNGGSSVINIEAKRNALAAYPIPLSQVNIVAEGNCPNIPVVPLTPYGGAVNITAYQGPDPIFPLTPITNVAAPGAIHLTAYSKGVFPGLITEAAGSILSYSGLTNPTFGVYGCGYYSALTCLSLTAGLTPATTSFPGTVYLRGDNGTKVVNGLYCDNLYNDAGGNLNIATQGGYWVDINNTQALRMGNNALIDGGGGTTSIIQNFYNINGSNVNTPKLNATNISTSALSVGAINTTSISIGSISTLANVDLTINANQTTDENDDPVPNNLNLLATSNINITIPNNNAYSINMSGEVYMSKNLYVTSNVIAPRLSTMNLNVSSINNAVYPPPSGVPSALTVSTLTASTITSPLASLSSIINVSTINGAVYPPPSGVPSALTVSTLTASSTIQGQQYLGLTKSSTWSQTASVGAQNWSGVTGGVVSGIYYACVNVGFIYYSSNGGVSWTQQATVQNWTGIGTGATATNAVACVAGGRIYYTTNSGTTWTVSASPTANWSAVCGSYGSGTTFYACVNGGGVYISTNSGANWTLITGSVNATWSAINCSNPFNIMVVVNQNTATYRNLWFQNGTGGTLTADTGSPIGNWNSVAIIRQASSYFVILGRNDGFIYITDRQTFNGSNFGVYNINKVRGFIGSLASGATIVACLPNNPIVVSYNRGTSWLTTNSPSLPWSCAVIGQLPSTTNLIDDNSIYNNPTIVGTNTGFLWSDIGFNNLPTTTITGHDTTINSDTGNITLDTNSILLNGRGRITAAATNIVLETPTGFINLNSAVRVDNTRLCYLPIDTRMASPAGTDVRQPFIQYGTGTGSGASGTITITLPQAYTASSSYVVQVTMQDAPPAQLRATPTTTNTFVIGWTSAGAGTQNIMWVTFGT